MHPIPFYKPTIGLEEIDEVVDTLRHGWLTTGPKTKLFEAAFSRYLGHTHSLAVNSCTGALHLALEAVGVRPGETVVVPTMTFAATAEVVRYFNARPLLVDCRPQDFNMDVLDASERIAGASARGEKVTAIIPVHYGGQVGDVSGVAELARRCNLKIVEDAAHCCPAFYRESSAGAPWRTVGSSADISCYSFYANKTITTGEGGMACTEHPGYAERMRMMSLHGISRDAWKRYTADGSWFYEILAPGFKYNLTDIAASIGLHQLKKADALHARRIQLASAYHQELADVEELTLPAVQPNRVHSWHLYVVSLKLERLTIDRAAVISQLKQANIGASVHWLPLHMHPYYRDQFGYKPADLPCAADLYPRIISLPLYPDMTREEVAYVCKSLKDIIARARRRIGISFPASPAFQDRKASHSESAAWTPR